jgi:hypothetical protein
MMNKALLLILLVGVCLVWLPAWISPVNAEVKISDAYDPGLPIGPWNVDIIGPINDIPGVGKRHTAVLSWNDGANRMQIKTYCIEPGDPSLFINDTCWKMEDTHQKLHCVAGQDQRWLETLEESWSIFLPTVERFTQIQQSCSCEGYQVKVKKNNKNLFSMALLPDPDYATGPLVTILKGDSVSVLFSWEGGDLGNDPCYIQHYVKIKLPEQSASLVNCSGNNCTFSCSEIGEDKTAKITAVVELVGETCLGIFDTYDPEGYDDPLEAEE